MKILVVSQYFWPENFRINDLTEGLVEKGHEVTVLTGIPNYPGGRFFSGYGMFKNTRQRYRGAKIVRVPLIPRGNGGKIRLAFNYFSFAFWASALAPLVCHGKYDVIFVYEPSPITVGLPAIVLKYLKSCPIVFWVQDLWPESLSATGAVNSAVILRMVRKMVNFIYRHCNCILVQSHAFIPFICSFGIDKKHILYFPNNTEEFYRPLGIEPGAVERKMIPAGFVVMFAGNIGAAQDFGTIVAAAEKLKSYKDIHWVIIGDGRMRQWAQEQVAGFDLGKNFLFLGKYPAEQMPRYFALADVLLVTLKNEEIFKFTIPAKVQSYLACAKPIVASLAGEGARIIKEAGAGLVCRPENPGALAEKVLEAYHMEESARRAMGFKGREYFENNFSREMLLNRFDEIMHNIKGVHARCVF